MYPDSWYIRKAEVAFLTHSHISIYIGTMQAQREDISRVLQFFTPIPDDNYQDHMLELLSESQATNARSKTEKGH